jgi:quercetin dioxygenase-like cupin family protein
LKANLKKGIRRMTKSRTTALGIALSISVAAFASACASVEAQTVSSSPVTHSVDSPLPWGPCPPIFPEGCQIGVLHGDPAAPNADIFLRVPAGLGLPAHTHTSAERIILVSGELRVKYLGAPAVTLKPGHYAYGPAALPHDATCISSETCTLFIAFEGPVDAIAFSGSVE